MTSWQNQYGPWALITGASAGLGAEFARQIAQKGLNVVLVARRKDRLNALSQKLVQTHHLHTRIIVEDLTSAGACERVAQAVSDLEIGLLINNAGFGLSGFYHELSPERLTQMTVLNCVVPVLLTNQFLPLMQQRKKGGIVFFASTASYQPCPTFAVYGATKTFNLMLGEALYREYKDQGIDILALSPGYTHTEFASVANIAQAGTFRQASAQDVVRHGLKALGKKGSAIHGWFNFLFTFCVRFLPRKLVTNITYKALKSRISLK